MKIHQRYLAGLGALRRLCSCRVITLATACLAGLISAQIPVTAMAATAPGTRIETAVSSVAPDANVVKVSYVKLYEPLPLTAPAHPEACDWISYLRFRHVNGPADANQADAVLVGVEGLSSSAGMMDPLARNVVKKAAAKGRFVEYWSIARREVCAEDRTGIEAAVQAKDYRIALDYYYGQRAIGGKQFEGFKTGPQLSYLIDFGLRRTMEDQYAIMRHEMPRQADRRNRMFCGGHSLGGLTTGAFAAWDFGSTPGTDDAAGFNQCAGYFALDTSILNLGTLLSPLVGTVLAPVSGLGYDASVQALRTLGLSYISVTPIRPEFMTLLTIAGIGAHQQPHVESEFWQRVTRTKDNEDTTRLLFSRDLLTYLTGTPGVRDFRLTNAAVFGALLDNNSEPLYIYQSGMGTFDGGPVTTKRFPFPVNDVVGALPILGPGAALVMGGPLMIPSQPHGPLYDWRNYDHVGDANAPKQVNGLGQPFTSAAKEVSDVYQVARAFSELPVAATEAYFPMRLLLDLAAFNAGVRSGDLAAAKHSSGLLGGAFLPNWPGARPTIMLLAQEGATGPLIDAIPPNLYPKNIVSIPSYGHVDVVVAAEKQNDGKPEAVSENLTRFVMETLAP